MPYRNLDEFLIRLEQTGELIHITSPVIDPTEITTAVITQMQKPEDRNKALWFDSVNDSPFPLVTNLFSTHKRMAWALGFDRLDAIQARMRDLVTIETPISFGALLNKGGTLLNAVRNAGLGGPQSRGAPVQAIQHLTAPSLAMFPAMRWQPEETHPSLTMVQIIISDQLTATATTTQHVHLDRAMIFDEYTLGIKASLLPEDSQEPIPAAIVLGSDPAATWSAGHPLPAGLDPYWIGGWIRRRPVPLLKGLTQAIHVPADAEIVIEGWIDPQSRRRDVVFAGEDGQYISGLPFATLQVTAITYRKDAVFPVSIPGIPRGDRQWMTYASEQLFLPILQTLLKGLSDIRLPPDGPPGSVIIASCHCHSPGQAYKIIHGLWGMSYLEMPRTIVVVDDTIDPHDEASVLNAILTRVEWSEDVVFTRSYNSTVYPESLSASLITQIGIDATGPTRVTRGAEWQTSEREAGPHGAYVIWHDLRVIAVKMQSNEPDLITQATRWLDSDYKDYHVLLVKEDVDIYDAARLAKYVLAHVAWGENVRTRQSVGGRTPLLINLLDVCHKHPVVIQPQQSHSNDASG
ncbi:MAG: UbiD family decarboxylase domain-containing protein [Chloroflexota bacterium]